MNVREMYLPDSLAGHSSDDHSQGFLAAPAAVLVLVY